MTAQLDIIPEVVLAFVAQPVQGFVPVQVISVGVHPKLDVWRDPPAALTRKGLRVIPQLQICLPVAHPSATPVYYSLCTN